MKLFADPEEPRQPDVVQFELEEWIDSAPFEKLLGLRIEQAVDGRALLTMPFTLKLANGGGVMHGGAMTTLADTAVAMAIKSVLPPGTIFATTELTMEFMAPIFVGQVSAHAQVHGPKGRIFHGECELRGECDELYARLTTVFKIARNQE
jgi:uncharacterized protein (TIGR00369 family)